MPTSQHHPERKRFPFKAVLLSVLVGGPLILLLVVLGLWYSSSSSLNSQLEALRAAGQPTTGAEINDFYVVPAGVVDSTDLWVSAIDGVTAANLEVRGKALPIIGVDGKTPIPPPGEAWEDLEASRTLLTELDPELQTVWKAAQAGGQARYPVDFTPGINTSLLYTQEARGAARLLSLDAHVAAHDQDYARALKDIRAIFALSDSLRGEPCLISQLVRIAIHSIGRSQIEELLPHCKWNDTQLQSLQTSIASAQFKQEMQRSLSGERATCLMALDTAGIGPFRKTNKLEALRLFQSCIDAMDGTWPESIAQQRAVGAEIKSNMGNQLTRLRLMGVLLLFPAIEQACTAGARAEAWQRTAIIGLAAQRHRLQHGELPASLAEIDPALLGDRDDTLFSDPFNGKQLIVKTDESNILIYSVGENEQDDGGDIDRSNRQMLDYGFKLQR